MDSDGPRREPDSELDALLARIKALEARMAAIEGVGAGARVVPPTVARAVPPPPAPAPVRPVPPPTSPATRQAAPTAWPAAPAGCSQVAAPPRAIPLDSATAAAWAARAAGTATPTTALVARAPSAAPGITLHDLEERFAGRALAWTGGLALIAAAIFFLSLAFSRGWITEPLRVVIGLVAGTTAFGIGAFLLLRRSPLLGQVLTGVGLGIVSISLFAATRGYNLVVPELGLFGALVAAVAAAVLAVRTNSVAVAAYGLVAALIAPPLVGASPTLVTLGFVAAILVGTTGIALFRSWRWLPPLAFVLAAPQLADWLLGDADTTQALIALAGFWALNLVAAAGEEVRVKRDDLRASSATLVLANATFLLWGGFVVLSESLTPWRGTFLGLAAGAHLLVGAWFLSRQGLAHLFGNLVAGTGVACITMAASVQLGAPAVPLAWAAEAVALAWLAARRTHTWSALAAVVLGALTISHLIGYEYPIRAFGLPPYHPFATPFLHAEAGSLAAVVGAGLVAAWLVPVRWIRSLLVGIAIALAAYGLTFEVAGPPLAAGLVLLALVGPILDGRIARFATAAPLRFMDAWTGFAWFAAVASALSALLAVLAVVLVEYPATRLGSLHFATPFLHPQGASLAIVLAGLVAGGVLLPARWTRSMLAGVGVVLLTWALGFEFDRIPLIATFAVLLPVGVILDRGMGRLPDRDWLCRLNPADLPAAWASGAGAIAWLVGAGYALNGFLRLAALGSIRVPAVPFGDERALGGGLLLASAIAAARWLELRHARRLAALAALAVAAYVIPFEVNHDWVAILWVALAVVAAGLARWDPVGPKAFNVAAPAMVAAALAVGFALVATPDRLWVEANRPELLAGWPIAFAAISGAMYGGSRLAVWRMWRGWIEAAAGAVAVYLASVAVVDVFSRQLGGAVAAEELAKQGQVALSVLWTCIGFTALATGFVRGHPVLRHAGFVMLGLATAKVFVIDLAAMDVAYRAVVFAALGVLLLISAGLVGRFRGPRSGPTGLPGVWPGPA